MCLCNCSVSRLVRRASSTLTGSSRRCPKKWTKWSLPSVRSSVCLLTRLSRHLTLSFSLVHLVDFLTFIFSVLSLCVCVLMCLCVCVLMCLCVCVLMCLCVCVQLLPKNCASLIAVNVNRKKAKNRIPAETEKPGEESYRKHREEFTRSSSCLNWYLA